MSTHWTEQDEATLRELTERKMRFTDEAKKPLRRLVAMIGLRPDRPPSIPPPNPRPAHDVVADHLIAHAAELRDALAPFDLRKPAPDPIEAAIQRGTFRFTAGAGYEYDISKKADGYWLSDDEIDARQGSYRTDSTVRGYLRAGTWRLVK